MLDNERQRIRQAVAELIERLAIDLGTHPEAVADVAFLCIQKHPSWGRNPTKTQKRASHKHWEGCCQGCGESLEMRDAVFHHLRRRIPNQHGPENLLPYHPGCHDTEHKVSQGSLSKGAPRPKE
jgi:hypothetical protein